MLTSSYTLRIMFVHFCMQLFLLSAAFADGVDELKSMEKLEKEYKESPYRHEINYEYCGKLIGFKKYTKAIEVCSIAIDSGTDNTLSWSYLNRGIAYRELGSIDKSKEDREQSKKHGMPIWLLDSYLKL
ncbi:MAG: hypothetical protein V3V12_00895 [Gammaproteobacteria bacterium]